jgi:hypothetical protein
MQIYVKLWMEENITLEAWPSDTVYALKAKINDKEGVPLDDQRLIFNGRELEDGRTLSDHGISRQSLVYLFKRPQGGGCSTAAPSRSTGTDL